MFWEKTTKEDMDKVKSAVSEVRHGKQNFLPVVYQMLASKDDDVVRYAASEIANYMKGLDSAQIIKLDENFRGYSSMEWTINWERIDLGRWKECITCKEDYLWVLRLGTFHPNGYFREKCVCELAGENASVRFAILRLNDWVSEVREAAIAASAQVSELSAEELVACLPYLAKVMQGMRGDRSRLREVEAHIAEGIAKQLDKVDIDNLGKYDIRARKYLYRLMLERKIWNKDEVNRALDREKCGQCQLVLMTTFLRYYKCSLEELDNYLQHKNKIVQRKAFEQKYSLVGDYWPGVEKLLLAKSAGVRGLASYILRKHTKLDIVDYYTQHLDTPKKKICILGIGENGSEEDVGVIEKYLKDESEGVVKSTLHSLSLLLRFNAGDVFWQYLQDERPLVMRAAYREIVANDIMFGAKQVYELFVQTQSELLKEKLAYQLLRERSWDRLPYILQVYNYGDETIRQVIQRGVYRRSVYGQITKDEAEVIRGIMYDEKYGIPEYLRKAIEFDMKFVVKG